MRLSTERLALSEFGGGLVAALAGELEQRAAYLYGQQLATPMIARALERVASAEERPRRLPQLLGRAAALRGAPRR